MPASSTPIGIGIVGVGKIVRDQHLPALAKNPDFSLAATASRNASVDGVNSYPSIEAMLAAEELDAVSLCMPPQFRYRAALTALQAGKHVFLEKPPGATVSEVEDLRALADARGISLFASWHSRYAPAVEAARAHLNFARLKSVAINWKEDVRRWHPNQAWIWQAGGLGVFDPGINALSVLTEILPDDVCVESALLEFPENQQAPIAANVSMRTEGGVKIGADFDFRQKGEQSWDIELVTTGGKLKLAGGGAVLSIDGKEVTHDSSMAGEYPRLYARFASLCEAGKSEVDWRPFQLVADAFLIGERRIVGPHEI